MAQILTGKEVAAAITQKTSTLIENLKAKKISPTLALVRMGEDPDDLAYEASIVKKAHSLGIQILGCNLERDATQPELESHLAGLNQDSYIHGILMFRPLPSHIDEISACNLISPEKDVDGVSDISMGRLYSGKADGFGPCTAEAVMAILDYYKIPIAGKRATVLGRSLVIGKPIAMMLLKRNATVTLCHRSTENLEDECKRGEILIAAAGKAGIVDTSFVDSRQTIIDVGIHVDEQGTICGDVKYQEVEPVVSALTPVPGGVGTVTTAILMEHVVRSAKNQLNQLRKDRMGI